MKKILVIMVGCTLLGYISANAQTEIIFGDVRYDGFKNVKKGAFWATRPEAKVVYEGGFPSGVEVYELQEDYFARFIPSEHNNLDRNYIVLPKGTRVYKKNGLYFVAICGNQLEYLRKVNDVKIIKAKPDTVYLEPPKPAKDTTKHSKLKDVDEDPESPGSSPNVKRSMPYEEQKKTYSSVPDEPKEKRGGFGRWVRNTLTGAVVFINFSSGGQGGGSTTQPRIVRSGHTGTNPVRTRRGRMGYGG